MGMAASQARYLALVARKSNCEYEGQQINQARLILSNQSANLFTQMLGLQVPVAPSKEDFAVQQYSFDVGGTWYTMDKWVPLSDEDSDGGYFNYAVTYHYNKDVEQGTQKIKTKPQVGFSGPGPSGIDESIIVDIEQKLIKLNETQAAYEEARNDYNSLCDAASSLGYYVNSDFGNITNVDPVEGGYMFTSSTAGVRTYINYDNCSSDEQVYIQNAINNLIEAGALPKSSYKDDTGLINLNEFYYDADNGTMARQSDIDAVKGGGYTILNVYYPGEDSTKTVPENTHGIKQTQNDIADKKSVMDEAKAAYDQAEKDYNSLSVPKYVGNIELKPIAELSETQLADIKMIIADMKDQDIECNIAKCFKTDSGLYNNATYQAHGGLYTYEQNGITYYTTYYDLVNSYINDGNKSFRRSSKTSYIYCSNSYNSNRNYGESYFGNKFKRKICFNKNRK